MKKNYPTLFIFLALYSISIQAQCSFTTTPYHEGFTGIGTVNQLPNCWAASNMSNTCLTYTSAQTQNRIARTGTEFASFHVMPLGMNYFYTKGIQLNVGVTYSASVWYTTEFYGYTNWSDLSILLGPNQNPTGLVSLASTNGPAVAQIYSALSGTFVVATSGVYYMAIRATSGSTIGAQYLSFDDVTIQVPCPNFSDINLSTSSTVICEGTGAVSFTASSPTTHSWSTGATGTITTFTVNPSSNFVVSVIGTNTLSGCSSSASLLIAVNPSPQIVLFASAYYICKGDSATLNVYGTNSCTWSTGQQGSSIVVSPTVTTSYSVTGSNNYGCTSSAVQPIQLYPLPVISISNTVPTNTICTGASDTLNAFGANYSYQWSFGTNQLSGNQIIVTPTITTTYVVIGTNTNNCSSQASFVLNVSGCTGINQLTAAETEIKVIPTPFLDEFLLSCGSTDLKAIVITDLSGRTILDITSTEEKIIVNTRYYASGIYYVKVSSKEKLTILKVIKA